MQSQLVNFIFLVVIILGLVMLANRLRVAYPIVLVLGGLALSLTARFSDAAIDPDLVFLIFLPPLLYEAAWQVSWKEFWRWRRVISSFAFPVVILTAGGVALAVPYVIPGFTLALGFLLGGIVSPPDAISASTILRQVKAPRTLVSIVEGESLLNDASSLIVFRFALVAVATGQFHLQAAALDFVLVIGMGVLIGVGVGYLFYGIHRLLPTTPSIEIVLTLITPYCMYLAAEHFHFSGVLAVVSGGLLLSNKRQQMLNYQSRLQGVHVWTSLVFVFNGLVFLLIGLQLPALTEQLGAVSLPAAIGYGLAISVMLMIFRIICTYGAVVVTKFMSHFITVADANPGWRGPIVLGWAGMRGVVSLAAALSIPVLLPGGQPFPHRSLILFITFVVILFTLVVQGLSLPWLIRAVKLEDNLTLIPEGEQEAIIQRKIAHHSLTFLNELPKTHLEENAFVRHMALRFTMDVALGSKDMTPPEDAGHEQHQAFQNLYLQLLEKQRELLGVLNHHQEFSEDLIRKYQALIDMEEYKLREKTHSHYD